MSNRQKRTNILKATPEELRLIAKLTAEPAFERLEAGELEVVDSDDWSDVPELGQRPTIHVPETLYEKIAAASRKRRTTPDRLASRWLAERLKAA